MESISYSEARKIIKDGDVVFIRAEYNSFFSKVIAFWTRGTYTHVGIAFWMSLTDTDDRLMIVESQRFTKRRMINLSYYSECELTILQGTRPWREYVDDAFHKLGTIGYSWIDAIHVGLQEYSMKWTNKMLTPIGGEFCSEFVARMLNRDEIFISPQRLYDQLNETTITKCITNGK